MVRPKKVPKHQWKDIFLHNTSANFILKILFIFAIANKGHSDFAFVQRHIESLAECFWHLCLQTLTMSTFNNLISSLTSDSTLTKNIMNKELMNSVSEMGRSMIGTKKKKKENKGMSGR